MTAEVKQKAKQRMRRGHMAAAIMAKQKVKGRQDKLTPGDTTDKGNPAALNDLVKSRMKRHKK